MIVRRERSRVRLQAADLNMNLYLLVSGDFAPHGGMDHPNHALAAYLAEQPDTEVHLVAHRVEAGLAAHPAVRTHLAPRPLDRDWLGMGALDRLGRRWARRLEPRGARVIVNGGNCRWGDVNWVHYVHAAYAAPARGWLRGGWQRWKHRRFLRDERRVLPLARCLLANSERTRRDLIGHLAIPADRIQVVYYGCDPALRPPAEAERQTARRELGWPEDRLQALFIGALGDGRKGFDRLFAAWQRLGPAWDVDLRAAGRGAELDYWRRQAQAAGMHNRIQMLGFRRDIPRLMAAADLLVAPVRYEAYGLAVQEALCRGVPALVSRNAGVAERYPPELASLLWTESDSPDSLAEALARWRPQAGALRRKTLAWSAELRRHDWRAMAAQILAGLNARPARGASLP